MNSYSMRTNESGSLVTFLVVGLVLATLVIGGVYTVQKRSSEQPSPSPVASAPADKKTTLPAPKSSVSPSASPHASPSQKPKTSPSPSPAVPSKSPSPSIPKGGAPLPATGPSEDFLASTLMFAGLVGVSVAYMRSRNALRFTKQVD